MQVIFQTTDIISDAFRFENLEAAQAAAAKLAKDEFAQESDYRFRVFDMTYTTDEDDHEEERVAFIVAATFTNWAGEEVTEVVK